MSSKWNNLFWSIRHLKSALKFVEIGRRIPSMSMFDIEGLTLMNDYYNNIGKIVQGGVILN